MTVTGHCTIQTLDLAGTRAKGCMLALEMQMSSHVVHFEMFSVFVCGGLELFSVLSMWMCRVVPLWRHCVICIYCSPPREFQVFWLRLSSRPFSSSPSRKPWETRPACQSRAAWGKMGESWRQTALRPCTLAPSSDMAPPSPWCPPTSHRNQKLTLCLKPSYPSTEVQISRKPREKHAIAGSNTTNLITHSFSPRKRRQQL